MQQYLDLLKDVLENGDYKDDRTGTGCYSVFGRQLRFNLQDGFPIVTTKKTFFHGAVVELLWILSGSNNVKYLNDNGVTFWNLWANEDGCIGPMYGSQLRNFDAECIEAGQGNDQLAELIFLLKTRPNSRRHVMTTWNPNSLPIEQHSIKENLDNGLMALAPCHGVVIQFYVANNKLSCQMYQRSGDLFLGVPINIIVYSLLTHIIAREIGLEGGEFIHTFGDAHIYSNHIDQVKLQLSRKPYMLPSLHFKRRKGILNYEPSDFELINYFHHDAIKGEVSV